MRRFGPAFIVSLLLHIGIGLLAFLTWKPSQTRFVESSSVPVEIISDIPQSKMAAAPVDPLAVKPPEPEPAPETPPVPTKPEPAPPAPEPKPSKADKKADAKTPTKADKDGIKKPVPNNKAPTPQKNDGFLEGLTQPQTVTSKAPRNMRPSPTKAPTNGLSQSGNAPVDMGPIQNAVKEAVQRNWAPCQVVGADRTIVHIVFTLSANGLITRLDWVDQSSAPEAIQSASIAKLSIKKGEPYGGLPADAYNRTYRMKFDPVIYCRNK